MGDKKSKKDEAGLGDLPFVDDVGEIPQPTPVDLSSWLIRDGWTIREACCLIMGLDPTGGIDEYAVFGPDIGDVDSLRELLNTAEVAGACGALSTVNAYVKPQHFIDWAFSKGYKLPWYFSPTPQVSTGKPAKPKSPYQVRVENIARAMFQSGRRMRPSQLAGEPEILAVAGDATSQKDLERWIREIAKVEAPEVLGRGPKRHFGQKPDLHNE